MFPVHTLSLGTLSTALWSSCFSWQVDSYLVPETLVDFYVPETLVLESVELPLGQPLRTSPQVQHVTLVRATGGPLEALLELQDRLGPLAHIHQVLVLVTVGILPKV